jgi:hypothetical protein
MPFVLGNSRLGVGAARKPPGGAALDVSCDLLGFLGLDRGIGGGCLLSQLARVDHQKAKRLLPNLPLRIFYFHRLHNTLPMPLAWWLLRYDLARRTVRQTGLTRFIADFSGGGLKEVPRAAFHQLQHLCAVSDAQAIQHMHAPRKARSTRSARILVASWTITSRAAPTRRIFSTAMPSVALLPGNPIDPLPGNAINVTAAALQGMCITVKLGQAQSDSATALLQFKANDGYPV